MYIADVREIHIMRLHLFFQLCNYSYGLYESHERIFEENFYFYCLDCRQFSHVSVPEGSPARTLILAQKSSSIACKVFLFYLTLPFRSTFYWCCGDNASSYGTGNRMTPDVWNVLYLCLIIITHSLYMCISIITYERV